MHVSAIDFCTNEGRKRKREGDKAWLQFGLWRGCECKIVRPRLLSSRPGALLPGFLSLPFISPSSLRFHPDFQPIWRMRINHLRKQIFFIAIYINSRLLISSSIIDTFFIYVQSQSAYRCDRSYHPLVKNI